MRLVRRDESVLEVYLGRFIFLPFIFLNATGDSPFYNKQGMILHENRLLADDSCILSCLIFFEK